MKLLRQALLLSEEDLSELPPVTISDIQSNIRKGAQDLQQKWANALELVHKAYSVTGIERPKPGMAGGWKQYEANITYAVEQLAKARGMKSDWRMSASSLHEATGMSKYKVHLALPNKDPIDAVVEASDIGMVVDMVKKSVKSELPNYQIKVEHKDDGTNLTFWLHDIRDNSIVKITPA